MPDPDYPHLNKKKVVVLVVVALIVLLLAALLAAQSAAALLSPAPMALAAAWPANRAACYPAVEPPAHHGFSART